MQNRCEISLSSRSFIQQNKIAKGSPYRFCVSPLIRPAYGGAPSPPGKAFSQSLINSGGNQYGFRLKKLVFYQASIFWNCSIYFLAGTFQLKSCSMSRFCSWVKASRLEWYSTRQRRRDA